MNTAYRPIPLKLINLKEYETIKTAHNTDGFSRKNRQARQMTTLEFLAQRKVRTVNFTIFSQHHATIYENAVPGRLRLL